MQRRDFIKTTCGLCGTGWLLNNMTACTPGQQIFKADITNQKIIVPESIFTTSTVQLVRAKKLNYDIALRQLPDKTYTATLLRCTHFDNPLEVTNKGYHCSLHGSVFNMDGKPTKGPAERTLKTYPVSLENNNIVIHI